MLFVRYLVSDFSVDDVWFEQTTPIMWDESCITILLFAKFEYFSILLLVNE